MRFHFPLEGLLRVRRLLEDQARERLEESMMRLGALEHRLAEAAQWNQQTARTCASSKPLPAIEMQFIESILRQTREAISQCQRQKQAEEQRAAQLRAAYLLARRERKTVSTLRDNALRQFQIEQSRRQQAEMDDRFLGKLLHARHNPQQDNAGDTAKKKAGMPPKNNP
jgi:flagellar export protein FliJ